MAKVFGTGLERLLSVLEYDKLIKEIEMYDDTLKIYFNTPNNSTSPDKSQGFCFSKTNDFGYKIEMYI